MEGTEFSREFDAVIKAVGEVPDTSYLPPHLLDERGVIRADRDTGYVGGNIFAGGDLVTGPSFVASAMAFGRLVAENIIRHLEGRELVRASRPEEPIGIDQINTAYFEHVPRNSPPELGPRDRLASLELEEVGGLSREEVVREADRCLSCGHCLKCGICWIYCPDNTIRWTGDGPEVYYDYCKGCVICANECPTGTISIAREYGVQRHAPAQNCG